MPRPGVTPAPGRVRAPRPAPGAPQGCRADALSAPPVLAPAPCPLGPAPPAPVVPTPTLATVLPRLQAPTPAPSPGPSPLATSPPPRRRPRAVGRARAAYPSGRRRGAAGGGRAHGRGSSSVRWTPCARPRRPLRPPAASSSSAAAAAPRRSGGAWAPAWTVEGGGWLPATGAQLKGPAPAAAMPRHGRPALQGGAAGPPLPLGPSGARRRPAEGRALRPTTGPGVPRGGLARRTCAAANYKSRRAPGDLTLRRAVSWFPSHLPPPDPGATAAHAEGAGGACVAGLRASEWRLRYATEREQARHRWAENGSGDVLGRVPRGPGRCPQHRSSLARASPPRPPALACPTPSPRGGRGDPARGLRDSPLGWAEPAGPPRRALKHLLAEASPPSREGETRQP